MQTDPGSIPYSELRAHLAETLQRLEVRDEPLYISRRGEPAGVLLSVAHYHRLSGADLGFGDALLAWRQRHAAALAAEEAAGDDAWPDADPFADVRDRQPIRPVTWPEDIAAEPTPAPPQPRRVAARKGR